MPIYLYECAECTQAFKVRHSMAENCEQCEHCGASGVARIPTSFANLSKEMKKTRQVGDITKAFIEDAQSDLKVQKKELDKKR